MKKLYLNPLKGMSKASESNDVEYSLVIISAVGIVVTFFILATTFITWHMSITGVRSLIVAILLSYIPNIYYYIKHKCK